MNTQIENDLECSLVNLEASLQTLVDYRNSISMCYATTLSVKQARLVCEMIELTDAYLEGITTMLDECAELTIN